MIFPFVCLFVDGHLGYFHSVVNNAAINIHVQVFMWHTFAFFLGVYQRVELLCYMVTLGLTF